MSTKSVRETEPQPSPGGWEAYRAFAFAVIQQHEERAPKAAQTAEVRDANRGNH